MHTKKTYLGIMQRSNSYLDFVDASIIINPSLLMV